MFYSLKELLIIKSGENVHSFLANIVLEILKSDSLEKSIKTTCQKTDSLLKVCAGWSKVLVFKTRTFDQPSYGFYEK